MGTRRITVLAAVALFVGLVAAQPALATSTKTPVTTVKAWVRVVASAYVVAPWTKVTVPSSGSITDSLGNSYAADHASALGALAAAADRRGFTFVAISGGDYVTAIEALARGCTPSTAPATPTSTSGLRPFSSATTTTCLLSEPGFHARHTTAGRARQARCRSETGQGLITVTVRGDALSAPNSAADAKRFRVDASKVVAPKDFPLVKGATIHVGNSTFVDGVDDDALDGSVTVSEPWYQGSYAIWAEKASDADLTYVRSNPVKFPLGGRYRYASSWRGPTHTRPARVRYT